MKSTCFWLYPMNFTGSSISVSVQTQTGWGQILSSFARWCQPQPGWRVLDVGCGPGLLPALFSQSSCQAFGVDLDFATLSSPGLHPKLVQADALHQPFPGDTFQLVTASNLLFLLPEPLPALVEMARLACDDGQIAVINPSEAMRFSAATALADQHQLSGVARDSLLTFAARAEAGKRWSEEEMRALFAEAGLQVSHITLRMGPGLVRFVRGTKR